jgi:hypothetical protein
MKIIEKTVREFISARGVTGHGRSTPMATFLDECVAYGEGLGVVMDRSRIGNVIASMGIRKDRPRVPGTKNKFYWRYLGISLCS